MFMDTIMNLSASPLILPILVVDRSERCPGEVVHELGEERGQLQERVMPGCVPGNLVTFIYEIAAR